jgi:(p)ppGpp synthase/HD superfamily hydrolase
MDTYLAKIADRIAYEAHDGVSRKWSSDPYVVHPRRVARKIAGRPGADEIDVAAALLHDVVEDVEAYTQDRILRMLLSDRIDPPVASAVVALVMELTQDYSKEEGKKMLRVEKRDRDFAKLRKVSGRAKRIKLCDRLDNLGASPMPPKMLHKYLPESRVIHEICSPADPELGRELLDLIERLENELAQPVI